MTGDLRVEDLGSRGAFEDFDEVRARVEEDQNDDHPDDDEVERCPALRGEDASVQAEERHFGHADHGAVDDGGDVEPLVT